MLVIKNLRVGVEGKEIISGVDLTLKPGEIQVVMGPNGSGKSTLAQALMGNPKYKLNIKDQNLKKKNKRAILKAKMELDGKDLLKLSVDQRAKLGLFLAFQYPVGIEGVSVQNFLKTAYEAIRCSDCRHGEVMEGCPKMSVIDFRRKLKKEALLIGVRRNLLKRSINDGFSGGEKKRMEILQMAVIKPKYAILDETDSGLDVDAVKTVARGIREIVRRDKTGVILITHYERILKYLKVDKVHVMVKGKIIKSGGERLADKLEKEGYKKFLV